MDNVRIETQILNVQIPEDDEDGYIEEGEPFTLSLDVAPLDVGTLRINWGDNTLHDTFELNSSSHYELSHTYQNQGPTGIRAYEYPIVITIDGDSPESRTVWLNVQNVQPSAAAVSFKVDDELATSVQAATEEIVLEGTFVDPGVLDHFVVVVDWGDGESTPLELGPADRLAGTDLYRIPATHHVYADDPQDGDVFIVKVYVSDFDEAPSVSEQAITVKNADPILLTESLPWSTFETFEQINFTDAFEFEDPEYASTETWDYTVDFEFLAFSGSSPTITRKEGVTTKGSFGAVHPGYIAPGNYTVTATIRDDDGGSASRSFPITITPATLVASRPAQLAANDSLELDVRAIHMAAVQRWSQQGISGIQIDLLNSIDVQFADLAPGVLGVYRQGELLVDSNAAGFGWFVDSTPLDNSEFYPASDHELRAQMALPANQRMDLLTVVMHEMGHALGFADIRPDQQSASLMTGSLDTGSRRLPKANNLDDDSALMTEPVSAPLHAALAEDIANGSFDFDVGSPGFFWDARGDAEVAGGKLTLAEDGLLTSGISQAFIVPDGVSELRFTIEQTGFVQESDSPSDAFEVALLDAHAMTPLVGTAAGLSSTDSLLNIQAGGEVFFGSEVTVPDVAASGDVSSLVTPLTIVVDVSAIPAGTEAVLYFDLLGFGSVASTVTIDDVRFSNGNAPPVANAGGPYEIVEGDDLVLSAGGSSDADGDPLTFAWDVNGDGVFTDATGVAPTLPWDQLEGLGIDDQGSFTVRLRVDDGSGDFGEASAIVMILNSPPTAALASDGPVSEGATAVVSFSNQLDPSSADTDVGFTYLYDFDDDGTFDLTSSDPSATVPAVYLDDNADSPLTVRARIQDKDSGGADYTTEIVITSVAPKADLANNGPVDEGSPAIVSFSNQFDPSTADTLDGFTYRYDFDDDGTFDLSSSDPSAIVPASYLDDDAYSPRVVRAVIEDKDGASTEYTTEIVIHSVAPTASLTNSGPVDEGSPATVTVANQFDPSSADTLTGFTYRYDFDNDGTFDLSTTDPSVIVPASYLDDNAGSPRVVRVRIEDKDFAGNEYTTEIVIHSVAPTASLTNSGPVDEGSPATVTVAGQFDPSTADTAAGFLYRYDFDNDGTFDLSSDEPTVTVPASYLDDDADSPRVVRVRIEDNDFAGNEYTTEIVINSVAPTASLTNSGPVDEGSPATVTVGGQFDPSTEDTAAGFIYRYDFDNDGTFDESSDEPTMTVPASYLDDDAESPHLVRVRIEDKDFAGNEYTTEIVINSVAPTASLTNSGPVDEGSPATVTVAGQLDPSAADTLTGFTYRYDFDNNGTFDQSSVEPSVTVPASFLDDNADSPHVVRVRIEDKDFAGNDYTTEIVINSVAPTASLTNSGPVDEGSPATVTVAGQFDPSTADTGAGFRYHYDFDNDGTFDRSTTDPSAIVLASYLDDNADSPRVVRVRIEDKDLAGNDYTTEIVINSVAPTASLTNDGPVDEGSPATVTVAGQFDPSAADTASGFIYRYDFDNDGTFDESSDEPTSDRASELSRRRCRKPAPGARADRRQRLCRQ